MFQGLPVCPSTFAPVDRRILHFLILPMICGYPINLLLNSGSPLLPQSHLSHGFSTLLVFHFGLRFLRFFALLFNPASVLASFEARNFRVDCSTRAYIKSRFKARFPSQFSPSSAVILEVGLFIPKLPWQYVFCITHPSFASSMLAQPS